MIEKMKEFERQHPYITKGLLILSLLLWAIIIAFFFTLPYMNGKLHLGADSGFHMNRIVSLATAINHDNPYPYLNWYQNYNFGYPTPIFYNNFMLYLPTQWFIDGKDIVIVFKDYVTLLVIISSFMMGLLTLKVSKYKYAPFLTMLVFQCNTHAITDVLRRGGLGELLALVFIPIILMGIYDTCYSDSPSGFCLYFGFTGLVLSHNISFLLMVILFGIVIIIRYKTLLNEKYRIVCILVAAVCSFFTALFFLAPMLEQMNALDLVVEHNGNSNGVIEGTTFKELFDFTTDTSIYLNGSAGPFLMFLPLLALFVKNKRKNNPFIYHCLWLGYGFYIAMTYLFPWKLFPIFSFLQFSQRLLPIAIPLLAIASGHYAAIFAKRFTRMNARITYRLALIVFVFIVTLPMLVVNYNEIQGYDDHLSALEITQNNFDDIQENATYNVQQLSSGDYLPYQAKVDYQDYREYVKWDVSLIQNELVPTFPVTMDSKSIDNVSYGHYTFTIANNLRDNNAIVIPRTYYVGYKVRVYKNQKYVYTMEPEVDKDTGLVKFILETSETPVVYDVIYEPTMIQTTSMHISSIAIKVAIVIYSILFVCLLVIKNKKLIGKVKHESNRWIRKYR